MRVLFIFNCLGIGGAQTYTISLANEFEQAGVSVEICVLSDTLTLMNRLSESIPVSVFKRKSKFDFRVIRSIRSLIMRFRPDVIISSYDLYTRIACYAIKDICVLYPIHTTKPRSYKDFFFSFLMFHTRRKNEFYLSTIQAQTDFLTSRYWLKKSFFHEIPNGIDVNKFNYILDPVKINSVKEEFRIPYLNRIILMVAGFRNEKRHDIAVQAFLELKKVRSNVSLVMVGDNRDTEFLLLKDYIKEKNLEDIIVLKASDAGPVLSFYQIADLFTLTSDKVETFPITVLEAMACGLPCVLTKVGGAENIVKDSFNGYLAEVNDPHNIGKMWDQALSNSFQKDRIRRYIIDNYSIKASVQNHLNFIKSIKNV